MSNDTEQESQDLAKIVDFSAEYADDFARLNYEWIEKYFEIEEPDRQTLERPQEKILDSGGHILLAIVDQTVVGTCALMRVDEKCFELAKMAVAPSAQGKKIGWQIAKAAVERARQCGATTIHLETNSMLAPAIALYRKLGFRDTVGQPTPYARCDVQMILQIDQIDNGAQNR